MTERQIILRYGGASGILATLILTAMIAVGLPAGTNSAQLLQPADPALVGDLFAKYSGTVKTTIVLDDLFALGYTGAFFGLAALVWSRSRWLAGVAMVFALATALLDFSENARLLAMAQGVGGDAGLTGTALRELTIITQLKYSCSHMATFLFGLGLPRRNWLSWTVSILLFLLPVVSTVGFVCEPATLARIGLMWLLLVLGGWLTWREAKQLQGES